MTPDTEDPREPAIEPRAEPTTIEPEPGATEAQPDPGATEASPEYGAGELHVGASDRCTSCGAELAVDQRYCVECGTRRGGPRFRLADPAAARSTVAPASPSSVSDRSRDTRLVTLLATIAVLLALGVGVLIGNAASSAQPIKVTLTGGTAASSTRGSNTAGSGTTTSAGSKAGSSSTTSSQNFFGGG